MSRVVTTNLANAHQIGARNTNDVAADTSRGDIVSAKGDSPSAVNLNVILGGDSTPPVMALPSISMKPNVAVGRPATSLTDGKVTSPFAAATCRTRQRHRYGDVIG